MSLTPDEERAAAHQAEQRRIASKRRSLALGLRAPRGPAEAVQVRWRALREAFLDRRSAGGPPSAD